MTAEEYLESIGHSWDSIIEEDSAKPYKQSHVSELMQSYAKQKVLEALEEIEKKADTEHCWNLTDRHTLHIILEEIKPKYE